MPPKASKGKAAATEKELARLRKKHAYFPNGLDMATLKSRYQIIGLCLSFSEFFVDLMHTFGFCLLDFTPNAMTCMSIFAHLCENFVGITPNTNLFRHYFTPRIQGGEALSGSIA
ncbi:hypothetical protein ZWY2020_046566 [Hordeum vulgare]|nr:hypothetical protein ZWY2020_046566 [Hordeum vulgare]